MSDMIVGVRDLKARLSEYLHRVKNGQTIIITDHGHPIGRLLPVEQSLDERIHQLSQAGMVAWNGQKLESLQPPAINRNDRQVSDILVEMRE